jgi:outer membrane receptor protein involved in Fe transport
MALGYYLQAAYRLRPQLEVLARYEDGFADRNLRDGEVLSDQTGGLIPHFDFYDHAWTAGLTWNPSQYMMLRAQYSRHNGTYSLAARENDPADLVKDWDLFALQFAVRF